MRHCGFVTIGQAPRDDILYSMLPPDHHNSVLQRGALDELSRKQIEDLQPEVDEVPLVTRLSSGEEVLVSKPRLMVHLQRAVDLIVAECVSALAVLGTGSFPGLRATVPVILPDRVLRANVDALLPSGTLGVIMPHDGQMEMMRNKWESTDREFVGLPSSPYTRTQALAELGVQLEQARVDLVVMDCMGFSVEMKQRIQDSTSAPVILANRLVGRIIEELIDEPDLRSSVTPSDERSLRP